MIKDQNTKELILNIAEDLIKSRGYNAFSYKDISTALNVKNAAIHYHFPAKKDLGVAVIQHAKARLRELNFMVSDRERTPAEVFQMFIDSYIVYLESEKHICLGGSLDGDFQTLPKEMQKEVTQLTSEILSLMDNILSTGREMGEFTFSGSSEDKSLILVSTLQGALQIARVSDKDVFYRVIADIKASLAG